MTTGHPYNGYVLRTYGTVGGEGVSWNDDDIYIALVLPDYSQDPVNDVHWSDIVAHEFSGGGYGAGGIQLTTKAPYIDATTWAPLKYCILTANAASTPTYSVTWTNMTFSTPPQAVVYKKASTTATSPLITGLDLSDGAQTADADKYIIQFGATGIINSLVLP